MLIHWVRKHRNKSNGSCSTSIPLVCFVGCSTDTEVVALFRAPSHFDSRPWPPMKYLLNVHSNETGRSDLAEKNHDRHFVRRGRGCLQTIGKTPYDHVERILKLDGLPPFISFHRDTEDDCEHKAILLFWQAFKDRFGPRSSLMARKEHGFSAFTKVVSSC